MLLRTSPPAEAVFVMTKVLVRWRRPPPNGWPATVRCWVRRGTSNGKVLALGRSKRLVSKAQRRALMLRDLMSLSRLSSDPASEGASCGLVEPWWSHRSGQSDLATPVAPHRRP